MTGADIEHKHTKLLKGVTFQPIFILGDHRSGTTLLYQLLDTTDCFNILRAYHIISYDEILFNHLNQLEENSRTQLSIFLNQSGVTDRKLDQVNITPDLPEEYGFLLCRDFRPRLSPQNLPKFNELCRKIQFISDPKRPLLLKNPWDFSNFIYIKETLPEAKFIFIHRNPVNLINSQIRAARLLYTVKSSYHALLDNAYNELWGKSLRRHVIRLLFSPYFELGLRVVTRHVVLSTRYYLNHIRRLDPEDYIGIKYEDLCENPDSTISEILNFLGIIDYSKVETNDFVHLRQTPLLEEVKRKKESIVRRIYPYFIHCGYAL